MAYSKDYVGDTVATGVLIKTLNKIGALVPNVTVNGYLAGSVNAHAAEFYYNMAPLVKAADAGADFASTNVGNKKAVIPLTKALQVDEKIPNVALATASDGGLLEVMVKAAIAVENARGKRFVDDIMVLASKGVTTATYAFDIIAEGIKTFNSLASEKVVHYDPSGGSTVYYSNATNGIEPTGIMVGDRFLLRMRQDSSFQNLFQGNQEYPAIVGHAFGLPVVYSKHLEYDGFLLLFADGVAYPYSISTLRAIDSEKFNGVRVQAEVVVPPNGEAAVLPIDTHALYFAAIKGKIKVELKGGAISAVGDPVTITNVPEGTNIVSFLTDLIADDTPSALYGVAKAGHHIVGFTYDNAQENSVGVKDLLLLSAANATVTVYIKWAADA